MITDLDLDGFSFVVEIATRRYLLLFFSSDGSGPWHRACPNFAAVADADGIHSRRSSSSRLAKELASQRQPDSYHCNNVLAHVPSHDFVALLKEFLSPEGSER